MINLLFVSISFPPKSDAECLQTAKYFRYLQQDPELNIEVVTSAIPTLYMSYDTMLESYAKGFTHQVALHLKENRWINLLRNRLGLDEMAFPDGKQSFHKQYKKAIRQIKQKPDVIYSRSFPLSSTVMAYKLKQYYQVPWILHLSDPWADAPLHKRSNRANEKHRMWEQKCMEAAHYVCFTSKATVEFYRNKYPNLESKFLLFPNVFEIKTTTKAFFPRLDKLIEPKLNIVFTGAMAEDRSPSFFLEPLRQLLRTQPDLEAYINVIFAGEADFRNRSVFEKYASPWLHYLGKVSYAEAQYLQQRGQLLLLIDNPIEKAEMAMFFPSKLLDYMVAQKKILAITTKGSASENVMQDLKGEAYSHEQTKEIQDSIVNAVLEFKKGNKEYFESPEPPRKYEAEYNARRLAGLIKKVVNE